jgi:O-antigen/teichoic acid export membrane protein
VTDATEALDGANAPTASELKQSVVSGARWITVARLFAETLLMVTMVVLAHLIPPSEFGKYAIVIFMQELAVGVLGGFGNAIVQRPTIRRAHLEVGGAIAFGVQLGLALLTVLVLSPLVFTPLFGSSTAFLVSLATISWLLAGVTAVPQALLQRRLDFRRLALVQLYSTLGGSVVQLVLAIFFDLDAEALVLGTIATAAIVAALTMIYAPAPFPRWRRAEGRDLMGYGVPASVAAISWAGFRNADYAIVGARLGAASAGIYWRAFQLAVEYQKKISVIMTQIAFPVLSRTGSEAEMHEMRLRMVRVLTVTVFPLLAGLVVFAPSVIPFVFGPTWTSAIVPTQVLAGAGAATLVIDAVGATLMAAGRARAMLGYGWGHFVVYATVVLIVSRHGIVAVATAAVAVHLVFLVIAYVVLQHKRDEGALSALWHDIAPAATATAVFLAVGAPIASAVRGAGVPVPFELIVAGAPALAAYLAVLRVAFPAAWSDLLTLVRRVLPERMLPRRGRRAAVALESGAG